MNQNATLTNELSKLFTPQQIIISLIIQILIIVSYWKIYQKADEKGWKSIVPFYSTYTEFRLFYGGNPWKFLLLLVPIANIVVMIKLPIRTAKSFGKSSLYGLGLLVFPVIFLPILAFGSAEYIGPNGNKINTTKNTTVEDVMYASDNNNMSNTTSTSSSTNSSNNGIVVIILVILAIILAIVLVVTAVRTNTAKPTANSNNKISEIDTSKNNKSTATPEASEDSDNEEEYEYDNEEDTTASDNNTNEDLTGLTYEDIYNEYLPKIDQVADENVTEFQTQSTGMSDDEKSTLADSLTEKVNDIAYEGSSKIFDIYMQEDSTDEDYSSWQSKLIDHAAERNQEIYDLEYAD